MSTLRYIVREKDAHGGSRLQVTPFDASTIVIGRGGSSQIILESHLVSLEHLSIDIGPEYLLVRDVSAHSGIRVNNRKVTNAEVISGDVLKFGDIVLTVGKDKEGWILLREAQEVSPSAAKQLQEIVRHVEASYNLPSIRVLSLLVITLVVMYAYVLPVDDNRLRIWQSGPISIQHQMLQRKCAECHQTSFETVPDSACTHCHSLTEHIPLGLDLSKSAPNPVTAQLLARQCTDCHREHRGTDEMTITDNRLCVECHSDIGKYLDHPTVKPVQSFAKHPEFTVATNIDPTHPGSGIQIALSDTANLRDGSHIKLNHKVHLEPHLRGPNGPVDLTCESCHSLRGEKKIMEPVSFDRNCRSCHPLSFDDRLPGKEVPHATPDIVYNFLYAEYAKLSLAKTQAQESARELPGRGPVRDESAIALAEKEITRESRHTESELFERTGCMLCHDISKKTGHGTSQSSAASSNGEGVSAFDVVRPNIPDVWLTSARFDHGAHLAVRCESCHTGASRSQKTTDVLLPKVNTCRNCHGDPGNQDKVSSNCLMCHSYHDSLLLKDDEKRHIEQIIHGAAPARQSLRDYLKHFREKGHL